MEIDPIKATLERLEAARRMYLERRIGKETLYLLLQVKDIELNSLTNMSPEESDAYFSPVDTSKTGADDPVFEADFAFMQEVCKKFEPIDGYQLMSAFDEGLCLQRRIAPSDEAEDAKQYCYEELAYTLTDNGYVASKRKRSGRMPRMTTIRLPVSSMDILLLHMGLQQLDDIITLMTLDAEIEE